MNGYPRSRAKRALSLIATSLGMVALSETWPSAGALQRPDLSLWSVDSIRSKVLSETRAIRVALPASYNAVAHATERYPILIVLDAQNDLGLAATIANARALAVPRAPAIPELIVVGVETVRNRYRDTTPPPLDGPARTEADAGGAPAFAEFLTAELIPYVSTRYRAMSFVVVAGHSMTGLFAAYLYGHSPTKINAVVALSPSLPWNGGVAYQQVLEGVRARAAPGRFFLGASRDEGREITGSARALARELAPDESPTAFQYRELIDDAHANTWVQGTIDGLRFIFRSISLAGTPLDAEPAQPFDAKRVVDAYAEVRQRYLAGARSLGFPERMPFAFGYLLTHWDLLDEDNPTLVAAVPPICEDVVRFHPTLWHGHECLGRASLQIGDLQPAARAFLEALRLAKRAHDAEGVSLAQEGLRGIARGRGAR